MKVTKCDRDKNEFISRYCCSLVFDSSSSSESKVMKPEGTPKPCPSPTQPVSQRNICFCQLLFPLFLNNDRYQALGVLNIDGLNVAVELLLGIFLVVSSSADTDT